VDFIKAILLALSEIEEPVITRYRMGVVIYRLYAEKEYAGHKLNRLKKEEGSPTDVAQRLRELEQMGILQPHPNFPKGAFRLLRQKDEDPAEVACTVDPFCYVSHLSAMDHHGLTDRLPVKLFLSSPALSRWKEEAEARMKKDLGEHYTGYRVAGMPLLTRPRMTKIGRHEIHRFDSVHWGAYKNVRGKTLRVATIGRTFLDMLRNPELCGGMRHVMQVYHEYAERYLRLIVDEIEQHGAPIDKVRAGYILEEKMGLADPRVAAWKQFAQRGGSRKLDASAEYRPVWSDAWCLSLNLD
jgi:predicted transcriptional regulator of viral defense system